MIRAQAGFLLSVFVTAGCGSSATSTPAAQPAQKPATTPPALADCPNPDLATAPAAYYACDCGAGAASGCQAGDDDADGTSPSKPWRSFSKAREGFNALPPGGMVALCRGGVFSLPADGGGAFLNADCRADQPCVVRDYGDAAKPVPIISTASGVDALHMEDGGNANHEEGYAFLNLELRSSGGEGNGVFVYNDTDDVMLCGLSISGFGIGVYLADSNPPDPDSNGKNERIVLRNSHLFDNKSQGFLGGCDGCSIEYSAFEHNGFGTGTLDHNIYIGGHSNQMRAIGNKLYRSTFIDGKCQGVSLVVHGEQENLLIEGNEIREDVGAADNGCYGIAVDPGYATAESFRNVTIRGNTVVNVGGLGIGVQSCQNCVIENNVVINEQTSAGLMGIVVPDRERGGEDLALSAVTVRNNSIYFGPASVGERVGIAVGGEGSGHVVVSNAVSYSGDAGSGSWSCFRYDLSDNAYGAIDYNVCGYSSGSWAGSGGLDAFKNERKDAHSVEADPGFRSVTATDYDLAPASATAPVVNAGDPSRSSPNDLSGTARSQPDVGAYEYSASK